MVVRSPPFQVGQQVCGLLSSGPGTASQRCHAMAHGQIHPFNERRVQPPRETQSLQDSFESVLCSQSHHLGDPNELAPPVTFLDLAVDQAWFHQASAHVASLTTKCKPLAKVGGEGIEVQVQAITGEKRDAVRGQDLSQRVDEPMSHGLAARADVEATVMLWDSLTGTDPTRFSSAQNSAGGRAACTRWNTCWRCR